MVVEGSLPQVQRSQVLFMKVLSALLRRKAPLCGAFHRFSATLRVITGLNKSDLILIGARPAMGKTSFALNLARNVAVKGNKKVVFFSLEMSKEQLAQRVLAMEARIRSHKMRTGNFTPKEWEQLASAAAFLSNCELYFDDTSNITVPEMKARTGS